MLEDSSETSKMFGIVLSAILLASVNSMPHLGDRIVGGYEIDIKDVPYQVSVHFYGSLRCGGSLIARDVVLTAAHCIHDLKSPRQLMVRVGSTFADKGGELVLVRKMIYHEHYEHASNKNDIALLRLSRKVTTSSSVQTISLAKEDVQAGSNAFVSGWGKTSQLDYSNHLRGVNLKIVSLESCRQRLPHFEIFDHSVCAFTKGKDSCSGDSGGPLVFNGKLIGIVSWGIGCAYKNYPGVYTRAPSFVDWIQSASAII